MDQAVCSRPLTAKAHIKPQASPRKVCGGHSGTVMRLIFVSTSIFPPSASFHQSSILAHFKSPNLYCLRNCHRLSITYRYSISTIQTPQHDVTAYTECPTRYRTRHFFNTFTTYVQQKHGVYRQKQ